ncbi:MliC family protein [Neisseria montereyensis]|uniref:MliC family protein n=1 Tax=Neisseria montereyensis TaxID=2973938 RepID=A0ABT2FEN1_9NEIS|nr:MliC family protein [Neisseria montereyensis]MCS4533970.1 MliC family protein [Neisseria montereyensis]
MKLFKLCLPFMLLPVLAACSQEQAAAPAETESAAATSAVETSSDTAPAALGKLAAEKDADWHSFQCSDGNTLDARYYMENNGAVAEVRFDNETLKLNHDAEASNADTIAFGNGTYTWRVDNQGSDDLYAEGNGFLTRTEKQEVASEMIDVDDIVMRNCMPL